MGEFSINVGELVVSVANDADKAELNALMREEDRAECRVFGSEEEDFSAYVQAFAVRYRGELLGIIGWAQFEDETALSEKRLLLYLSTIHVENHRLVFVRHSRRILELLCSFLPAWVSDVYAIPMTAYAKSILWQTRVLGFRKSGEIDLNGINHTILHRKRNEVTK